MKRIFLLSLFIILQLITNAQGLEGIIVEKYYITDDSDAQYVGSASIAANSVTYRVYVDMKPGYRLQSVYGAPGHKMRIGTSTFFFNHSVFGHYIPNLIMDRQLGITTLMLDSWIGMGAASQQKFGILKQYDDTLGTAVNGYDPPILQSENPAAGIPIKYRDGLIKKIKPPLVTQLGMDSLLANLYKINSPGQGYEFMTSNGAWACLGGAEGPYPETNQVLIGQFTTNGRFYFELNMQLGTPDGGVEQYVAKDPQDKEILNSYLIYNSAK